MWLFGHTPEFGLNLSEKPMGLSLSRDFFFISQCGMFLAISSRVVLEHKESRDSGEVYA